MNRILILIAIFSFAYASKAQSLVDLENEAHASHGTTRVEKLLHAANAAFNQQDFNRAIRLAEEAENFADKIDAHLLQAEALNKMGKVMLQLPRKKGLFGKRKPEVQFEKSNDILERIKATGSPLYQDNLAYLRLGKELPVSPPSANNAPIMPSIPAATVGVNGPAATMADIPEAISPTQILAQSEDLQQQLALKQANLDAMTQSQVKVEFMLLQQRQLLDSLLFRSSVDSLLLSNQKLALREAETNRNLSTTIAAVLLLLSGVIAYGFLRARKNSRVLAEKNNIIEIERQRSEQLLLNILPTTIADELKTHGSTKARFHDDVSVLFADFENFTKIAERITPQQLVSDLDTCFRAFDDICKTYQLEKIKTIGDAYLVAGGLDHQDKGYAVRMVNAARDMHGWLAKWNQERTMAGLPQYHARIGIHCGPVVSGVVGAQKFAYDIWGDTVNIAARIEQAGQSGQINLSAQAYAAVQGQVACQHRGRLPVKNKGEIDMYFVVGVL